jgi:hypothetical protein
MHSTSCNKEWFDREMVESKKLYILALHSFNGNKSIDNRQLLFEHKLLMHKKKGVFKTKKSRELCELRKSKPKQFWNHFKSKLDKCSNNVKPEEFREYFASLFNDLRSTRIEDVESFISETDLNINNPFFECLNTPFTYNEILMAIKDLKRNKAPCPADNLLNGVYIETSDILIGHITDCFNTSFDSDHFPKV